MSNQVPHTMLAMASVVSASALGVHARSYRFQDGAATRGIDIIGVTPVAFARGPRAKGATPSRHFRRLRKGGAGCDAFERVSPLETPCRAPPLPTAAEEQSPVRLEFALGLMWMVALWSLNLGFISTQASEDTVRRSLEDAKKTPSLEAPRECESREDPHPSEAPCIAESAVPHTAHDLKSVADHGAVKDLLEEVRKEEELRRNQEVDAELYESMVRKHARSLPALAVQHPTSACAGSKAAKGKPGDLRKNLLKRTMARGIILEGIDKLREEVAEDCDSDSRASMALADFHHVKEQLVESTGLHEDVVPGSPAWKRLCRVVSFLRRNVDAAPM